MPKNVKLKVGVQDNLKEISIEIADNAPRPWDGMDRLNYIGGKMPRIDGKEKASGRAKYTFDVQLPGMLFGKFLRSPHPAAIIKKIDSSKAEKYPGVKAVIRVQEKLPMRVRFAGQEIIAVAAETARQAEEALKLIDVQYEKVPFVITMEEAMKPNAPIVFDTKLGTKDLYPGDLPDEEEKTSQKGNTRGPKAKGNKAEVEAELARCDMVVEQTYKTQVQTHSAMETHGVVAQWESDNQLTVWASTQGTFSVRDELASVFNLSKSNVRVLTEYMGGGFGAKFGAGVYGIMAAKLAKQAHLPVRLMLDRKEEHLAAGNRPSSMQTLKIGADKDGMLKAIRLISYGSAGVGTGAGTAGPAQNMYYGVEKSYTEEYDVFINAGPGAAFRAPGHPQGAFALEQAIDELAYKLNLDPLEFRRMNLKYDEVCQTEYEIGAKQFGWEKRHPKAGADQGPVKRGVGMANALWYYFYGTGFQVEVQVHGDGSVELTNGVQDIGTGIRTVMAMVAAEELGLEPSAIAVKIGDTNFGLGPASGGSQTTGGITPAVRHAAYAAKLKMFEIAAPLLKVPADALSAGAGKIFVTRDPTKNLTWKQVASKIAGDKFTVVGERVKDYLSVAPPFIRGVQFAEVEVDTETGMIAVKRVLAVHDCGRPMNRLTTENQINGGIIQGISYALFEDRLLDRNTGLMVNANFDQYKISGSMDIPEIETVIIDVNRGSSGTGAMGIGEPATVPTAAAIANAVYHAIGVRLRDLPMTSAKVLKALRG
jgi:xanthine dehydrogenase YagR molybdenum-binding subunit